MLDEFFSACANDEPLQFFAFADGHQNRRLDRLDDFVSITASIILQLLTVVSPSLEKLSKEGEVGQARITQYTRYLTVGLAAAQSVGYVFLFRSQGNSAGTARIHELLARHRPPIVICLTAGCVLLMWMGEQITERGIGNGISLIIFAGIVGLPAAACSAWWTNPDQVFEVIMPFLALGVIAAIVFFEEGQRRIRSSTPSA